MDVKRDIKFLFLDSYDVLERSRGKSRPQENIIDGNRPSRQSFNLYVLSLLFIFYHLIIMLLL
jgi:hypothetical protein